MPKGGRRTSVERQAVPAADGDLADGHAAQRGHAPRLALIAPARMLWYCNLRVLGFGECGHAPRLALGNPAHAYVSGNMCWSSCWSLRARVYHCDLKRHFNLHIAPLLWRLSDEASRFLACQPSPSARILPDTTPRRTDSGCFLETAMLEDDCMPVAVPQRAARVPAPGQHLALKVDGQRVPAARHLRAKAAPSAHPTSPPAAALQQIASSP